MAYLVLFDNNIATDAVWTDASMQPNHYIDFNEVGRVKSFYVDTDQKEQAVQIANSVIKQVWGKIYNTS